MPTLPFPRRLCIAGGLAAYLSGASCAAASAAPTGPDDPSPKGFPLTLGAWSVHSGGANVSGGPYSGTVSIGQVEMPPATVARASRFELTTGWLVRAEIRADALFSASFEP